MNTGNKKLSRNTIIMIVLAVVTVIAVCVTIWALTVLNDRNKLTPDYAIQEAEKNAQTIDGENDSSSEAPRSGGSISLSYAKEVKIDLSEAKAELLLANPSGSTQNMILQIVIDDTLIAQSGSIGVGKQLGSLDISGDAVKLLKSGVYNGKFIISYYSVDSGEKAMVNTEIPVTISVTK